MVVAHVQMSMMWWSCLAKTSPPISQCLVQHLQIFIITGRFACVSCVCNLTVDAKDVGSLCIVNDDWGQTDIAMSCDRRAKRSR